LLAQQVSKIPDSERAPASMKYVPLKEYMQTQDAAATNYRPPMAAPASVISGTRDTVGIMINAYTSQSTLTNQVGYNPENDEVVIIYRAGPADVYDNPGNGSLVLRSTSDKGDTWSPVSDIFNEDLPGNIQGEELSARHPSIYAQHVNGGTHIASMWSNIYATFLTPTGVLGEIAHKAGPYGGPYTGNTLDKSAMLQYFPTRMVSDRNGNLYSLFQSINPDLDELTGDLYLLKSTDNGTTWTVSSSPVLSEASLPDDHQIFYSATTMDVSPDGSMLVVGFLGILVEDGSFTFTDNKLGYLYSNDGGNTWSDPIMKPLYEWTFENTPSGEGVNTLDGWMLPSMSVVVDGNNKPHFLMSVNGQDGWYPLDSMLIGEVTVDLDDENASPEFYALRPNILPDFRRKINPRGATSGAQPTFSIWAEHEWSKTEDGMDLVAKWIDADSLFVVAPAGHTAAFTRDSTHDIFTLHKKIANEGNEDRGWATTIINVDGQDYKVFDVKNATNSKNIDEKFTKMNPKFNLVGNDYWLYFIFTIMAEGEFVTGEIYPDTDDLGEATLAFVPYQMSAVGIGDVPEGLPGGFVLEQNYPNPFNPTTNITYSVPSEGAVTIRVFNMLGKEVGIAFQGNVEAGPHTVTFNASNLPSGQYLYRLEHGGYSYTKMMTLMK
jgi:hypothetical protein